MTKARFTLEMKDYVPPRESESDDDMAGGGAGDGGNAGQAGGKKRKHGAVEGSGGGGGGGSTVVSAHDKLKQCLAIVKQCEANENCYIFSEPVSDLDAPGYSDVVSKPMDLGTVQHKLKLSQYDGHEAFAADMRLVWANCKEYNENGSEVWGMADELENLFETLFGEARLAWADAVAAAAAVAAARRPCATGGRPRAAVYRGSGAPGEA